jgi:fructose-specific phosphotransferase system IIC component
VIVGGGAVSGAVLMGAGVTSLQPCSRIVTCYMTTHKFVVWMISTLQLSLLNNSVSTIHKYR